MAEETGLTCCEKGGRVSLRLRSSFSVQETLLSIRRSAKYSFNRRKTTYILLPHQNLHRPSFRHDLRNIAQPYFRPAVLVRLHAQVLQHFVIKPASRAELGEIIFQALDRGCDVCFESGEIIGVLCRNGVFLGGGLRFGFVASGFAALFEEGGSC